jgi:hypothetical protein
MNARLSLSAVAAAVSLFLATDAAAQAKSNIQDDPNSSNCTANCVDAGYEWAIANTPAGNADCAATNEEFKDGCEHWVEEQAEASAPPPEQPADAAAPADEPMPADAAAPADEPMPADEAPPADDSAPPSDDLENPPANNQ